MDFPITASGTHIPTSKPLLLMPDQDHPNTMNQIAWSLMYILQQKSLAGIAFDPDVTDTYTRLYQAIAGMISDSALSFADLVESRAGALTDKVMHPAGVAAASGNFSTYVSVATTPYTIVITDVGGLHIATASANAITLPLLSSVQRVGSAFTVQNFKTTGSITVSRSGADTLAGVASSTTSAVLSPGQSLTFVKISAAVWAVIGSSMNDTQNTQIGIGCALWAPCRALIPNGFTPADGQLANRSSFLGITAQLGVLPTVTDANWISTYANRGSYSTGDGATTFRFPDYNGKYADDVALFFRGDGGNAAPAGQIQVSDNKAHTHSTPVANTPGGGDGGSNRAHIGSGSTNSTSTGGIEARPENVAGVWCVRAF